MSQKILNLCQSDFFFFCLFILARHVSPVLHHPLIISKFQLLSEGKLPCFSWNTLVIALEGCVTTHLLTHTHTSAFHLHAHRSRHICLPTQANQNLSLFFSITSSVFFSGLPIIPAPFVPPHHFWSAMPLNMLLQLRLRSSWDRTKGLLLVS